MSLLVNASFNGSTGPQVRLPLLGFAIPAALAVAVTAATARLRWRWWQRALLVVAIVVVGVALTAGALAQLSVGGSLGRVAVRPWSSHGHRAAVVAAGAWFVASLVWARGTWLGTTRLSFSHAAWSAGLSALAFLGIFIGRAPHHDVSFRATTGDAVALFFLCFLLTGAALLLIRQREIEEEFVYSASASPAPGPGLGWLAVLAAPLVVVAGLALVVAVGGGPFVRVVGRVAVVVARAVGRVVVAFWRLLPRGSPSRPVTGRVGHGRTTTPVPSRLAHPAVAHGLHVPTVVGLVVGALGAALVIWAVLRYVLPYIGLGRRGEAARSDVVEERDSVFTWAHLLAQVRLAVYRLRTRARSWRRAWGVVAPSAGGTGNGPASGPDPLEGIRGEYRRVLLAARQAGTPRVPTETTLEFARRLAEALCPDGPDRPDGPGRRSEPLDTLTSLYQRVRYGDARPGESAHHRARQAATEVVTLLENLPGPPA